MPRPILATIHLGALRHNLAVARQRAQGARVWAVVKANAYGHGIARVFDALRGADGFALLDLAEAELLRKLGWRGPILLLEGVFEPRDLEPCSRLGLWHAVHTDAQIDWLSQHKTQTPHHVYLLAAWFNLHIPLTRTRRRPMPRNPLALLPDFRDCNRKLWHDKLGQISLASTTLFWGVSGNLRYVVLAWAAAALGYGTTQASALVGVVALGTASGAVFASMRIRLDRAPRVISWGIAMGALVMAMNLIHSIWVAVPFLILMGALGGFLVVPMNALLQHRGHHLMGAGRSIAVQNFNEQLAILLMGAGYSACAKWGLSAFGAVTAFGATVVVVMWLIGRWYAHNLRHHREEMSRLKVIARRDR